MVLYVIDFMPLQISPNRLGAGLQISSIVKTISLHISVRSFLSLDRCLWLALKASDHLEAVWKELSMKQIDRLLKSEHELLVHYCLYACKLPLRSVFHFQWFGFACFYTRDEATYWKIQACDSTCVPKADFRLVVFLFSLVVLQMEKSWCALRRATLAGDGDCKTAGCVVMSQDVRFWCRLFSLHSNWFLLWFPVVFDVFWWKSFLDFGVRLSFFSACFGNIFWVQEQKMKRNNGFSSADDGVKLNRRCFGDQRAFVSAQSALSAPLISRPPLTLSLPTIHLFPPGSLSPSDHAFDLRPISPSPVFNFRSWSFRIENSELTEAYEQKCEHVDFQENNSRILILY